MSDLKIGIIIGSTRPGRNGEQVAKWVLENAEGRDGASYELIDLLDYNLPHLDEAVPAALGVYTNDHTKAWAEKIGSLDGFVFVTPEYNHSTSGALKNAIDYIYAEWNNKAAGFVGYGSLGGARAVENLRAIASELQMAHVRQQVALSLYNDWEDFEDFKPEPANVEALGTMFDQLESWAAALATVRG